MITQVELHRLFREINSRLDRHLKEADEGLNLDAALDFCRFVFWSGLLELLKRNSCSVPLTVDGPLLAYKVGQLQGEIQRRFSSGDSQPNTNLTELSRINHKLDLIAGQLSHSPRQVVPESPPLVVLPEVNHHSL